MSCDKCDRLTTEMKEHKPHITGSVICGECFEKLYVQVRLPHDPKKPSENRMEWRGTEGSGVRFLTSKGEKIMEPGKRYDKDLNEIVD